MKQSHNICTDIRYDYTRIIEVSVRVIIEISIKKDSQLIKSNVFSRFKHVSTLSMKGSK